MLTNKVYFQAISLMIYNVMVHQQNILTHMKHTHMLVSVKIEIRCSYLHCRLLICFQEISLHILPQHSNHFQDQRSWCSYRSWTHNSLLKAHQASFQFLCHCFLECNENRDEVNLIWTKHTVRCSGQVLLSKTREQLGGRESPEGTRSDGETAAISGVGP